MTQKIKEDEIIVSMSVGVHPKTMKLFDMIVGPGNRSVVIRKFIDDYIEKWEKRMKKL
jgi:hypothetical protein